MKQKYYLAICFLVAVNLIVYVSYFRRNQRTSVNRKKCQNFITSSFLTSGLGNIMFQYASMYGVSQKLHLSPVLTEDILIVGHLRLAAPYMKNTSTSSWSQALEVKSNVYDQYLVSHINPCYNITLVGYFQSWKYFQHVEHTIREQFTAPESIVNAVQRDLHGVYTQMLQDQRINARGNITFVGVHVRRGDFLEFDKVTYGYTVADMDYLKRAIHYMEETITQSENNIYVVATDDPDWTKTNLKLLKKQNIFHSEYDDAFKDLALLAQCNHSIISVGTYSWWSGWLAGGQVIYYKDFPRANSKLERAFSLDKQDYFPPSWIGL